MPSAICFNLDQSKILSSGYGLKMPLMITKMTFVLIISESEDEYLKHYCRKKTRQLRKRKDFSATGTSLELFSNPYQTSPSFDHHGNHALSKRMWEKKKLLMSHISFISNNVSYSLESNSQHFSYINPLPHNAAF